MQKDIRDLSPHPLSIEIYGPVEITGDFLDSIAEFGILTPLLILPNGIIVSGHRRWLAAKELGLKDAPVILSELTDPLDIEQAVIESNRQRVKTFSQKMREGEELERITSERKHQEGIERRSILKTSPQNFGAITDDLKETVDVVAKQIGIGSGEQYRKSKKVWQAAQGGDDIALAQVERLDAKEITVHKALRTIEGMAVHYSSDTSEWHTPSKIIELVLRVFDDIDLDPCSNSREAPNVPAAEHYTKDDDGLSQAWHGRIYMNPPYGRKIAKWVKHLCKEYEQGNISEAIALVSARTDTEWFRRLRAYPRCFIWGRLRFSGNETGAPFPSMAVYLGGNTDRFIGAFKDIGDIYVWSPIDREAKGI